MKTSILSFSLLLLSLSFNFCYGQKQAPSKKTNAALHNYVHKPDASFAWQQYQQVKGTDGVYYEVNLLSQTWQNILWKHRLIIYFPTKAEYPHTMLVVVRHLYDRNAGLASLKTISDSTGTPAAILYDVPNQPLFEGKEEDDLQAYTFSQYIKTGDESWPLLFPMVKSVVRAMDAAQLLARRESKAAVDYFVVAGHSKRGHTTWLTAAADKRVQGIIPMAIDILNSSAQLPHHLAAFKEYSTPSKAATDFLQELDQPRGESLLQMVDAYSYREQLTLPKLIVSATNDDFFTTDALNLYWDGLKDPKWVLYLSNTSHVRADADPRINPTAFAFVRAVAAHKNLPKLSWQYEKYNNKIRLKIKADSAAAKARLWTSQSDTKDFRPASWTAQPMFLTSKKSASNTNQTESFKEFEIEVPLPVNGYLAIFGEIELVQDGRTFLLSTQTNISSHKK